MNIYKDIESKLRSHNIITSKNKLNPKFRSILDTTIDIILDINTYVPFIHEDDIKLKIRMILDSHTSRPECVICSNHTSYDYRLSKFKQYCSHECSWSDPSNSIKAKSTKLKRYGDRNFNNRVKAISTNQDRYGVNVPTQNKQIIEQIKQTKILNNTEDLAKKRRSNTMIAKYGTTTYAGSLLDPTVVGLFEDYEWVKHQYIIKNNSIAAISKKHNVSIYYVRKWLQAHSITKQMRMTDVLCVLQLKYIDIKPSKQLTDLQWVEQIVSTYNLSKSELAFILHTTLPYVHFVTKNTDVKYSKSGYSLDEHVLLSYVKSIYSDQIIVNTKTIIPPYELDIYLPDVNIAIEYNGIFWHSDLNGKSTRYHVNKTDRCTEKNIRLIQVFASEWINKPNIVKSRIANVLNKSTSHYARKCNIVEMTVSDKTTFLNNNHIQGSCGSEFNYGLQLNGEFVACITFGKSRFSSSYECELLRYCSKLGTTVVGGASKLFKHFINTEIPQSIVTYSDNRWNTGKVYTYMGFTYSHTSSPNYHYFKASGDTNVLYSRQQFQKHKLRAKLDIYDSCLTEWQNMQANGYDRIWDCGNNVWVWYQ